MADNSPKVLLVDDSESTLAMLTHIFESAGATVAAVSDGQEALDRASAETFDLIAMDIRMPHMDGNTAAHKIRENGFKGPIIAFTAAPTVKGKRDSTTSGFDAYFNKSLIKKELAIALLQTYANGGTLSHP